MQQLGAAFALLIAGLIVVRDARGKLQFYGRVGYMSIIVLVLGLLVGRYIFPGADKKIITSVMLIVR